MGDLLCSDYERAAANRKMVANKENIVGYLWIEAMVRGWPYSKPLPGWLYGNIPIIHRSEASHSGMSEKKYLASMGMHEVKE